MTNQKTVSHRTYYMALLKLQSELDPERRIAIYDMGSSFGNEPIQLGVNWSAIGTVPASEAVEFAQQLMAAAKAAEDFEYNGYVVTYGEG